MIYLCVMMTHTGEPPTAQNMCSCDGTALEGQTHTGEPPTAQNMCSCDGTALEGVPSKAVRSQEQIFWAVAVAFQGRTITRAHILGSRWFSCMSHHHT